MKRKEVGEVLTAMYEGRLPDVRLNAAGAEILDPVPMAPPVGYKKSRSMVEVVRDMLKSERLALEAAHAGVESFEEADDFEVGDDFDPTSPYENDFEPTVRDLRQRQLEEELLTKENADAIDKKPDIPAKEEKIAHGKSKARSVGSGTDDSKLGSDSV